MRQLQLFTTAELARMRDRTRSRNYSPERDEFRRAHERRRAWGLARRHAEKLRRLRDRSGDPRPAATSEQDRLPEPAKNSEDAEPVPSASSSPLGHVAHSRTRSRRTPLEEPHLSGKQDACRRHHFCIAHRRPHRRCRSDPVRVHRRDHLNGIAYPFLATQENAPEDP